MIYTIVKNVGRSGWLIDDGSGSSIRYATKAEAAATIAKWERRDRDNAEFAAIEHAARIENVKAYLAVRAARAAEAAKQLDLF